MLLSFVKRSCLHLDPRHWATPLVTLITRDAHEQTKPRHHPPPSPLAEMEAHLAGLSKELARPKLTAGFDEAAVKLTALHKHVADSAHFLPAFDARQAQEVRGWRVGGGHALWRARAHHRTIPTTARFSPPCSA